MPKRGTRKLRTKRRRGTKKRGGGWFSSKPKYTNANFHNAMLKISVGKKLRENYEDRKKIAGNYMQGMYNANRSVAHSKTMGRLAHNKPNSQKPGFGRSVLGLRSNYNNTRRFKPASRGWFS